MTVSEPAARDRRWVGVLLVLGAALLWSVAGVAVKVADVDPIAFTALRSAGAVLGMIPLLGVGGRLTGRAWPGSWPMAVTAAAYTLMVAAFVCSMSLGTAAEGILLQSSAPAWAALFAWLFLGRRVTGVQLLALAVASAGVAVMLFGGDGTGNLLRPGPLLGIASGVGYAGVMIGLDVVDGEARRRTGGPANVVAVVLCNNAAAALTMLPWAFVRGGLAIPAWLLAVLLVLGVWQMALPYVLFQLGLRRVGPIAAGLIVLVEPVLNPLWAWLGAGEIPPDAVYLGGGLILLSVAVTVLFGRRSPDIHDN